MPPAAVGGWRNAEALRFAMTVRAKTTVIHRGFVGDAPMTFVVAAADLRRFCPSFCEWPKSVV
jgi:hypothetical protein